MTARARHGCGALALAALTLQMGCSLGRFDDQRDRAWADATDHPDGVDGREYPIAVASLSSVRPGAHFVTLAADPPGLATVSYGISGSYEASGVNLPEIAADALASTRATVAAANTNVAGADSAVAVGGLGDRSALLIYDARSGSEGPVLRRVIEASECGGGRDLGRHMVWTRTALGVTDEAELVVSVEGGLIIFVDLAADSTPLSYVRCAIADIKGMAAADFDPTSLGDELALGLDGQVVLTHATTVAFHSDRGARCFTEASPFASIPSEGEADFGAMLAAGNSNELAIPELAIAAPSAGKVYVFSDMSTSGPSGPPQALARENVFPSFATSMAFGDLNGDGFDELIVGDPGDSPSGAVRAGSAWVYAAEQPQGRVTYQVLAHLYDRDPEADQRFGTALAVTQHSGTLGKTDVLLVGAAHELFTYFRALAAGVDPRE